MVMNDHLKDGHGLAIDHNVEHGVPQQIRQHIQQVNLAQDHVAHQQHHQQVQQVRLPKEAEDHNAEHGFSSSIDSTSDRYT